MRKVANVLLWLYIFTVPWDVVAVPGVGTLTRVMGMIAISAVLLMVLAEGRFRKPDSITIVAAIFTGISALSIFWTISYPATTEAVWSYIQLFGSVWAVRETAHTKKERQHLLVAFCLGVFVPMVDLLVRYATGSSVAIDSARYTATGQNADTVGSLLVVGIPLAWQLMMTSAGASRLVGAIYVVLAPLEVLLTGVRGAFLALLIAMSVIPLSVGRASRRWMIRAVVGLLIVAAAAVPLVPRTTWVRIATIPSELLGGSLSSRRQIWGAGLAVFPEHPLLGVGAGTYGVVLENAGYHRNPAHNLFLGLLVEQGFIGLSVFVALLAAAVVAIRRMPPFERKTWAVLMLSLTLTLLSQSLERWKVTWLLLALLAAQNEISVVRSYKSRLPVRTPFGAIPVKPTS